LLSIWYRVCFILHEKERKNLVLQNAFKKNCYEKENNRLGCYKKESSVFIMFYKGCPLDSDQAGILFQQKKMQKASFLFRF